ncbi:MAG: hypothetical protein ACFFAH_07760 [Promethearchaeota archaeon]
MVSKTGLLDGITATFIILLATFLGILFLYFGKKSNRKLFSIAGLMMFFVVCLWLGPFLDFLLVLLTGRNLRPIELSGYLSYIWFAPVIIVVAYIIGDLIAPEKKWYMTNIFGIFGYMFVILLFLDTTNTFEEIVVNKPGEDLINVSFNQQSLAFIIITVILISALIILGIGYAIKSKQTNGGSRIFLIVLSIIINVFIIVGVLDYIIFSQIIFKGLINTFTSVSPISVHLLFQNSFQSVAFPVLIAFTLLGLIIIQKPQYQEIYPSAKSKKFKLEIESKPVIIEDQPSELEEEILPEHKIKKKKKLRGFPGVIYTQFNPLNNNEKFKEKIKKTSLIFLLNPIDQLKAALVIFNKGTVEVEEYKKVEPLMKLYKKLIGYDAMLQVTTKMFLDIATGKLSTMQLLIAERKDKNIKVKGKLKLLKLLKALKLLEKMKTKPEAIEEKPSELEPKIIPEGKIEKKKKLRGFAGVIHTQFNPLNNNEVFKEKFKKTSLKFLLNPIDQLKTAIVIFNKGTVEIEEYKKLEPLMKIDKKLVGYNAMLQVTTEMLLNIAMGEMSVVQLLIAERKDKNIKVKGKLKLLKLLKALKLLKKSE